MNAADLNNGRDRTKDYFFLQNSLDNFMIIIVTIIASAIKAKGPAIEKDIIKDINIE
jgi:hypothetical protein